MKAKKTTVNYPLIIIQVLVILIFFANLITGVIKLHRYLNHSELLLNINTVSVLTSVFLPSILAFIPLMGIFLKSKYGWTLIISYFYFLLTNMLFSIALLLLIVFALNKKKIYEATYKIIPSTLLFYNIVGFIIGVSITLFLAYTRS